MQKLKNTWAARLLKKHSRWVRRENAKVLLVEQMGFDTNHFQITGPNVVSHWGKT